MCTLHVGISPHPFKVKYAFTFTNKALVLLSKRLV